MQLTITAIHLTNPQKAKDYAEEKISKLAKYHPKIEKIEVRLINKRHKQKKNEYDCEIKIVVPGHDLEIMDSEQSIEAAIDKAEERAKRLLVKNKEKHLSRDHKQGIVSKLRKRLPF